MLGQLLLLYQLEVQKEHPNVLFSYKEEDGREGHHPASEGFNLFSAFSFIVTPQLLCTSLLDATGPQNSTAEMETHLIIYYEKDMVKNSNVDGGFQCQIVPWDSNAYLPLKPLKMFAFQGRIWTFDTIPSFSLGAKHFLW